MTTTRMDGSAFLAELAAAKSGSSSSGSTTSSSVAAVTEDSNAQKIDFNGSADMRTIPLTLGSKEISVRSSSSSESLRSQQLTSRNLVKFSWDHQYYHGRLCDIHLNGRYMAYSIFTHEGLVRVVRHTDIDGATVDSKTLLKGMKGKVMDVAVAHTRAEKELLVGVIDSQGTVFVFEVREESSGFSQKLLLTVKHEGAGDDDIHRFIWCPYLPDEESEEDERSDRLFVATSGSKANLYDLDKVISSYGSGPLSASDIENGNGRLEVEAQKNDITDASFSPDGTAIAMATSDGEVKFYQVYMNGSESPRCLHNWPPHDGKQLTSLFFMDNHKNYDQSTPFWKFAVTGAERNNELKVWSCESWQCLQTIRFKPDRDGQNPVFKAALDPSGKFLLLSEINRGLIYALHFVENGTKLNLGSISEFATPTPFLSLSISDVGVKKSQIDAHGNFKVISDSSDSDSESMSDDFDSSDEEIDVVGGDSAGTKRKVDAIVVDFVAIQPKHVTNCRLFLVEPEVKAEAEEAGGEVEITQMTSALTLDQVEKVIKVETLSEDEEGDTDQVANISIQDIKPNLDALLLSASKAAAAAQKSAIASGDSALHEKLVIKTEPRSPEAAASTDLAAAAKEINLMSPEAFVKVEPTITETIKIKEEPSESLSASLKARLMRSGNSSPSREVQDILEDSEEAGGLGTDVVVEEQSQEEDEEEEEELEEQEDFKDPAILSLAKPSSFVAGPTVKLETPVKKAGNSKKLNKTTDWPATMPSPIGVPVTADVKVLSTSFDSGAARKVSAPAFPAPPTTAQLSPAQNPTLEALLNKMSDMTNLIQTQRAEMNRLREELRSEKKADKAELKKALEDHKKKIQETIRKETSSRGDSISNNITSSMNGMIQQKLEQVVRQEMKKTAQNVMQQSMQSVTQAIEQEVHQRSAKADNQLRDALTKSVNSRQFGEQTAQSLANQIAPHVSTAFREGFAKTLVPAFERSMQQVLAQLSANFARGLKEHEARLGQQLTNAKDEQLRSLTGNLSKELSSQLNSRVSQVCAEVSTKIEQEIINSPGFKEKSAVTANVAAANAEKSKAKSIEGSKITIRNMLTQGNFEGAFQTALTANNLNLVLDTCEMVNPSQIFTTTPCLSQPILLSLIQQLSHNLDDRTELKRRFLQDALMSLDDQDPVTRNNASKILGELRLKLQAFLQESPRVAGKELKMLTMAAEHFIMSVQRGGF